MPMIDGAIQDYALTLDKFLDHAAKWRPSTEVVTARADGSTARIGYAGLRERAKRVTSVLSDLGVKTATALPRWPGIPRRTWSAGMR